MHLLTQIWNPGTLTNILPPSKSITPACCCTQFRHTYKNLLFWNRQAPCLGCNSIPLSHTLTSDHLPQQTRADERKITLPIFKWVCLRKAPHAQQLRAPTHSVSQAAHRQWMGAHSPLNRSVKLQGTAWAGHRKAETLLPFSGPHHILHTSTHMFSPIYFVRALDACQISWWANSVHYLGKEIMQQNPKHKIIPNIVFCWVSELEELGKGEPARTRAGKQQRQNSPLGGRARGSRTSPIQQQSCWMYSAVSCNFTRSNLTRRVQCCNSFKLTSAGTASGQPPHPSLRWG